MGMHVDQARSNDEPIDVQRSLAWLSFEPSQLSDNPGPNAHIGDGVDAGARIHDSSTAEKRDILYHDERHIQKNRP